MTSTQSFRLALPRALLALSPSLAASHAARARILDPEDTSLSLSHCQKCGTYLFDGSGSIRTTRPARRHKRRTRCTVHLRAHCSACDHVGYVSVPPADSDAPSGSFPMPRTRPRLSISSAPGQSTVASARQTFSSSPAPPARNELQHAPPFRSLATPNPSPPAQPFPSSAASRNALQTQPKRARPKKKAGLQELLARNRDEQQQASGHPDAGLSAFLSGL